MSCTRLPSHRQGCQGDEHPVRYSMPSIRQSAQQPYLFASWKGSRLERDKEAVGTENKQRCYFVEARLQPRLAWSPSMNNLHTVIHLYNNHFKKWLWCRKNSPPPLIYSLAILDHSSVIQSTCRVKGFKTYKIYKTNEEVKWLLQSSANPLTFFSRSTSGHLQCDWDYRWYGRWEDRAQ